MKLCRILLSVVLSLAMVLGMAWAGAETLLDGGLILRNVSIHLNGDEITLPYEARLNAAVEDAGARLNFEVGRGAGVLLPLRGEIDQNGVRFSLGSSGRVYSLDLNMLAESAGVDMDDVSEEQLAMVTRLVEDYIAMLQALILPENVEKLAALEDEMLSALTGSEGEEAQIEYEGASYPGKRYAGGLSLQNALSIVNLASNTGIGAVDSYFANALEAYSQVAGMEIESLDQFFSFMIDESGMSEEDLAMEIMDLEIETGGDENLRIERVTVVPMDSDMEITVEEITAADKVEISVNFGMGDRIYGADVNARFTAGLAEGAVTAFNLEINAGQHMDVSSEDYINTDLTGISFNAEGKAEGGLWSAGLVLDISNETTYGTADDQETLTEGYAFTGAYDEIIEEDGSVTSAIALGEAFNEQEYGLSFELNVAEGKGPRDVFGAGAREYSLTDDDGVAYELLEMDAATLYADVLEFTVDEDVLTLMEAVNELSDYGYEDYGYDDYSYDYDSYESGDDALYDDYGYADYDDYDYEAYDAEIYEPAEMEVPVMETVYSMEAAAEIFAGEMPAFTAPEGYALEYVEVDAASFYADYANAGDKHIGLMVIDFGMDLGRDGDEISYYEDENGNVFAAELYSGNNYVLVQFDSATQEAAEEILSGFAS